MVVLPTSSFIQWRLPDAAGTGHNIRGDDSIVPFLLDRWAACPSHRLHSLDQDYKTEKGLQEDLGVPSRLQTQRKNMLLTATVAAGTYGESWGWDAIRMLQMGKVSEPCTL